MKNGREIHSDFLINLNNIDTFVPIEGQRLLRKTAIERIQKAIIANEFIFENPIFVNKRDKQKVYRILDGNHRLAAVSELLKKKKLTEFKVALVIYHNLTDTQEKDVYDLIAKQTPQSVDDLLNLHKNEFELWNCFQEKLFPVKTTIYSSHGGMTLKTYLMLLYHAKYSGKNVMGIHGREGILYVGLKSTEEDFKALKEFFEIFVSVFGYANNQNRYAKPNVLAPLFYIWYVNKDRVRETIKANKIAGQQKPEFRFKTFWQKKFEKLVGDPIIIENSLSNSTHELRLKSLNRINELFNKSVHNTKAIKTEAGPSSLENGIEDFEEEGDEDEE